MGKESVIKFVFDCKDLYVTKADSIPIKFYCWFDELSSQLRLSAISSQHNKLPFGCQLNVCDLSEIVHGLFNNDSGLYSKNAKLYIW